MKRALGVIALLLVLCAASTASAQGWTFGKQIRQAGNFGVGFGAGTFAWPLSLKYFASDSFAVQGNIGWWRSRFGCKGRYCGGGGSLSLSADAIIEMPVLVGNGDVDLAWNFGGGAGLGLDDWSNDIGLGVAGVLGLELLINAIPIDIVLEYRPGLLIIPFVDFDFVNFTGHLRFYF